MSTPRFSGGLASCMKVGLLKPGVPCRAGATSTGQGKEHTPHGHG